MFLLPWSTGSASEKVLPKEAKGFTGKNRTSSVVHLPLLNTKRKWESNGTVGKDMAPRPAKRRLEQQTAHKQLQPPAALDVEKPHNSSSEPSIDTHFGVASNNESETPVTDPKSEITSTGGHDEAGQHLQDPQNQATQIIYGKFGNPTRAQYSRADDVEDPTNLTPLKETIESQFSLEILLKHREFRLIEHELAKCQVALEQLRRCHVMPYPAMSSDPETVSMVSSGAGPSYGSQAQYPPPWGVVEGPYSRHYAKWLIPDSAFGDDGLEDIASARAGKGLLGRADQGSKAQKSPATTSSRSQRGSARERLQALPHGYPVPKEAKGPMILKRSTDGRMVKLICLDCRREDFNSAQGFINHCRIAHSRGFASHDAAAIACGEEVEMDSEGEVVGEIGGSHASAGLVHPLIKSANLTRTRPTVATSTPREQNAQKPLGSSQLGGSLDGSSEAFTTPQPASHGASAATSAPLSFKPSPQAPHLSALFARSGRGGDLDEMVTEARKQPEPETPVSDDSEEDDEEMEDAPEQIDGHHTLGTRGVIRGGGSLPTQSGQSSIAMGRSPNNKSINSTTRRKPDNLHTSMANTPLSGQRSLSYPSNPTTYDDHLVHQHASPADSLPTLNLSPNTIESHPAPSLVSDDGDYDNAHSDSETPSSAVVSDTEDTLDVEVKDHEHHDHSQMDIDEPSGSSTADLSLGKARHGAPPPRRRAPDGVRQGRAKQPPGGLRRKGGK